MRSVGRPLMRSPRKRISLPGRQQTEQHFQGARLAHAVAAEQGGHLAGLQLEAHAEQHLALAVAGFDVFDG